VFDIVNLNIGRMTAKKMKYYIITIGFKLKALHT